MNFFSEEYFDALKQIPLEYISRNYDLCYLKAMHEEIRQRGADTVIVGSSHAMNGLLAREMSGSDWGKTVNLSVSSQDIWFDYQHMKKVLSRSKTHPKNCIINFGYYMLYQDLSKSGELSFMLPRIYAHLFGCGEAMHHMRITEIPDLFRELSFDREMFPEEVVRPLCETWSNGVFMEQGDYYGNMKTREQNSALSLEKVIWETLDESEKDRVASRRAGLHNVMKKYRESRVENESLLREMVLLLHENDIRTFVVITPYTGLYNHYTDPVMKREILELLESIPAPIEYLDMNDYPGVFTDEHFIDSDHLNEKGALLTTVFLNEYLHMINRS